MIRLLASESRYSQRGPPILRFHQPWKNHDVHRSNPPLATLATQADCESPSRGTIVVADDDCATRLLLCRVLTRAAFTVYAVENGELACEEVRLRQPDVVLLDWIMPVMDGRRAVELLKADVRTQAIPIVMLTTHSRNEERMLALEAGVQDFLTKPFDPGELVARIERQIAERGATRMLEHSPAEAPYLDQSKPSGYS
jgi:DNA-binding response OmpR family regulator